VVDVTGNAAAAMPTNTSLCLQLILTNEVYRATARCSAVTPTLSAHSASRVWTALVNTNERTNNNMELSVISDFRREVAENGALLDCYAAIVLISYRRFGTAYRSILRSRPKRRQEITTTDPVTTQDSAALNTEISPS